LGFVFINSAIQLNSLYKRREILYHRFSEKKSQKSIEKVSKKYRLPLASRYSDAVDVPGVIDVIIEISLFAHQSPYD